MAGAVHSVRVSHLSNVEQYASAAFGDDDSTLVHFAGACPIAPDGSTIGGEDVRAQTLACIDNLRTALALCGSSTADLVHTRVLVATTSRSTLVAAWEAYRDALAPHDPPSTLMGVTVLGYDGQLVEIEAVAAVRSSQLPTT